MLDSCLCCIDAALAGSSCSASTPAWIVWLVVSLLRQRSRQVWHREVVSKHLGNGAVGAESGDVPGHPGWTFHFHGIGCCLRGPEGEQLDVDFRDERASIIDPWFFAYRVRSIRTRDLPEVRLWRWMATEGLVVTAIDDLRCAQVVLSEPSSHLFRLAPALEERVNAVSACDFGVESERERWIAALRDDESEVQLAEHCAWVTSVASRAERSYHTLPAAQALLRPSDFLAVCHNILEGPITPGTGRALEVLGAAGTEETEKLVWRLLDRLSPTDDAPYPAFQALRYLSDRRVDPETLAERFKTYAEVEQAKGFRGNPFLAQYAILALRCYSSLAMPLVRRALRSTTPVCVQEMSALLVAIDQPWCLRELASALREHPAQPYLAEALRRSSSQLAQRQAASLYEAPEPREPRVGYTFEEVLHNCAGGMIEESIGLQRAQAEELRKRYPSGWNGDEGDVDQTR